MSVFWTFVWTLLWSVLLPLQESLGAGTIHVYPAESDLVQGLCKAQQLSWCMDLNLQSSEVSCDDADSKQPVQEGSKWLLNCSESIKEPTFADCVGACSTMPNITGYVAARPEVTVTRDSQNKTIVLSWGLDPRASGNVIYVVSQLQQYGTTGSSWLLTGWVRGDYYQIKSIDDICVTPEFRVAAVSQSGSRWFSHSVKTPALIPGPPQKVNLTLLYYRPTNLDRETIHYTLEWEPPRDWSASDLSVNHKIQYEPHCVQTMDTVYVFVDNLDWVKEKEVYRLQGRIPTYAIGCNITFMISAVSSCNERLFGKSTDYSVELRCDRVPNYNGQYCHTPPVVNPGPVRDVKLAIIPLPDGLLGLVSWRPPARLGSAGRVESYHLFWGIMDLMNDAGLILDFKLLLGHIKVPGSELGADLYMNITSLGPYETVGVVVRAAGPGQIVDTPYGDINLAFNRLIASQRNGGEVISDDGTLVVVEDDKEDTEIVISDTAVHIYWRRTQLDKGVGPDAGYGVLWGIAGPYLDVNSTSLLGGLFNPAEDSHFFPLNMTTVADEYVYLDGLRSNTTYGVKVITVVNRYQPLPVFGDQIWTRTGLHNFTTTAMNVTSTSGPPDSTPSSVTVASTSPMSQSHPDSPGVSRIGLVMIGAAGLLVVVLMVVVVWRCGVVRRRRRTPSIAFIDGSDCDYRPYSYFAPGTSLDDMRPDHCPVVADEWELPLSCVKFGPVLGSGAFGKVVKGRVTRAMLTHRGVAPLVTQDGGVGLQNGDKLHATVAIKMLQEDCDSRYKQDFLKEIHLMKRIGYHDNVVSMLGCCTLRDPICLIVEHVEHGDLLNYLKNVRHKLNSISKATPHYVNRGVEILGPMDLLRFAWQIAKGMEFLASKGFVHRDLAARNVLVAACKVCKIGDFGLARFVYDDAVYVNRRGGRLPVKWMSVEAIFDMSFSSASDVWSFGIVLYELVTLGGTPYPTIPTRDILKELQAGYRMERPDNCSLETYEMMLQCWKEDPEDRPTFTLLVNWLDSMMADTSGVEYLDLKINFGHNCYKAGEDDEEEDDIMIVKPKVAVTRTSSSGHQFSPDVHQETQSTSASILYPNTLSEDSGYHSPQKESVSSGGSAMTLPTEGLGGDYNRSSGSRVSTPTTKCPDVSAPKTFPGFFTETIVDVDDVFHEDNSASSTAVDNSAGAVDQQGSGPVKKEGAKSQRRISRQRLYGVSGPPNPESILKLMINRASRRYSLPNLDTSDTDDSFNVNKTLDCRRKSDGHLVVKRQTVDSQPNVKVAPYRKLSRLLEKAKKTKKFSGNKQRRKAVVVPPTLALDNNLYQTLGKMPRQNPPVVRISRKRNQIKDPKSSKLYVNTDEGYTAMRKSKAKKTASVESSPPTSQKPQDDGVETQSCLQRQRKNSQTVVVEVHCGADQMVDSSVVQAMRQEVQSSPAVSHNGFLARPCVEMSSEENSVVRGVKARTFVRSRSPVISSDVESTKSDTGKRRKMKNRQRMPIVHQYADFKNIISHFSRHQDEKQTTKDDLFSHQEVFPHNDKTLGKTYDYLSPQEAAALLEIISKQRLHRRSLSEDNIVQLDSLSKVAETTHVWKRCDRVRDWIGSLPDVVDAVRKEDVFSTRHSPTSQDLYGTETHTALCNGLSATDVVWSASSKSVLDPSSSVADNKTTHSTLTSASIDGDKGRKPQQTSSALSGHGCRWHSPRRRRVVLKDCGNSDVEQTTKKSFPNEKHPSALHLVSVVDDTKYGQAKTQTTSF